MTETDTLDPASRTDRKRVVVVDDSDFDRRMIRRALSAAGPDGSPRLDIVELSGGLGAVDAIRRDPPDLVILDIRMPGVDGFQVLSAIRARSEIARTRVVMISGSDQPADRQLAREHGADAFYVKPPSASDYLALGETLFQDHVAP
ncbi:MAG: response regulator [Litorimonas sp.]